MLINNVLTDQWIDSIKFYESGYKDGIFQAKEGGQSIV